MTDEAYAYGGGGLRVWRPCCYRAPAESKPMIVPMIMIQQNAIHIVLRSDTRRCPQFGQRKARFETTCPHAGHGFSSFGFPAGGFGRMSCPHTGQTVARLLISLPQAGQDLSHVASCVPICFSFVVLIAKSTMVDFAKISTPSAA